MLAPAEALYLASEKYPLIPGIDKHVPHFFLTLTGLRFGYWPLSHGVLSHGGGNRTLHPVKALSHDLELTQRFLSLLLGTNRGN